MASWLPNPYRIIVLGGGISGLSAAHTIVKYSEIPCHVTIVESQARIGGWLESTRFDDGTVFEHGPRSARSYGKIAIEALHVISDLGLEDKIIGIPKQHDAARRRYIYAKGKLNELPSSFSSIVFRQDPFTKPLLSTIIKEPFVKKGSMEDESVHAFFKRRFNSEMADYLSDPMCRGIFGGDAKQLSLRSCLPILFEYEQNHGSVIKGALFSKSGKSNVEPPAIVRRAKAENWMAWTLRNGIQTLPELWCKYLESMGLNVLLNTHCHQVSFTADNKVQCTTDAGVLEAERLISSLPSCSLAPIIKNYDSRLSSMLGSVKYANMAVINLEYQSARIPYQGFGFLVPSSEPVDILGITFDSLIFPEHSKKRTTIATVMSGGVWFEDLFGHPDNVDVDKITELAVKSAKDILNMTESPVRTMCKIQKECIPQYLVGHEEKCENIKNYLKTNNFPLTVVGNTWGGVGVNDVIVNSRNETLKWLAANHMY